jgi:hypothetical protein
MRPLLAIVLLAGLLTGCSTAIQGRPVAGAELSAPVPVTEAWKRDVTSAVAAIGRALGTAGEAMINSEYSTVRRGCRDLEEAADLLEDQLPSEDEDVNEALQNAVDEYRSFAGICVALTPNSSGAEIDRLESTLDRADASIRDAMALLDIDMPGG